MAVDRVLPRLRRRFESERTSRAAAGERSGAYRQMHGQACRWRCGPFLPRIPSGFNDCTRLIHPPPPPHDCWNMSSDLHLDTSEVPLLMDLYELTMAASYVEHGFNDPACFSLCVRRLPQRRGYLVAAGTERLFEAVETLRFDARALEYLDSLKLFKPEFLDYLSSFRFTGNIRAMPEGTIFFGEEPIVEVDAPLIEAQMLETLAINQVGVATMIASKAARCYGAAGGRRLIEFGLRRCQGADAGLVAARSSYVAGFNGTANVLA